MTGVDAVRAASVACPGAVVSTISYDVDVRSSSPSRELKTFFPTPFPAAGLTMNVNLFME
jgi:uncharacterized protein YegL